MINWEEQWAYFAPGFVDGKAHIELKSGHTLKLTPGPGFGDYSHSTTKLMIALMDKIVPNHITFDIGCGSGILSVAAGKLGAKKMFACDIDPEALVHTEKNGQLNDVVIDFNIPEHFSPKPIVLMNMIASEQVEAWREHACDFDVLITSGILKSAKESYLQFANLNGWNLIEERELDGWLGFIFQNKEK